MTYPNSLDSLPLPSGSATLGGSTPTHLVAHQAEVDAILAIEAELGVLPKGASASVAAKLAALTPAEIPFFADNGTDPIPTGTRLLVPVTFACTITGWSLVADVSGSIVIDVRKGTPSSGSVTTSTIVAAAPPTLASAQVATGSVPGWTTAVAAGDCLEFVVTGTPLSVHRIALKLAITRA